MVVLRPICLVLLLISNSVDLADARQSRRATAQGIGPELPPGWSMERQDPEGRGLSFVSPDGSAWITLSKEHADSKVATHMQALASIDEEQVTYLRTGRSWIVVSGFKGDRIFYRKAMLACAKKI